MTKVHELLDLPESVRKGDFVQSLAGGIDAPQATVASYAITPAIVNTFEHALTIIDSALKNGVSQAAYLHGSFGSGKSHFMAILNLMLANHTAPWERGELHQLKAKFDWIGTKKLLQLPMHFLDARSIESHIFETYVRWVCEHHPEAEVPALFADQALFDNAAKLRVTLGDETFFAGLNSGRQAAAGWGQLAAAAAWDGPRFAAALSSTEKRERERLFSALVKTHFTAFAGETSRFIELDRGLQVLARHAKALGYDGVVLYLDELILWLASNASDVTFIQREVQKLVKLKEAQHDRREVPIVAFIARQRDLAQLVGEQARGAERAALEDSFKHHQGRFEEIRMADSNLPAIVKHRVLRPKNDRARDMLAQGFTQAWSSARDARSTLVGSIGNEEAFRQVYPFSPALVEALVDLSDCLQRERTAIRILMELLVEHLPGLELGSVVPVGDAYDVIAGGEEPFDQVMADCFNRARHLYEESFLPAIQAEHGTTVPEQCQRLRPGHPRRLGCSGCLQTACRNDNRLAKTLLLAALVPGAETFKDLTVKRLVHLNHGTIATPIPGTEVKLAEEKLRRWSAQVGPLRVGDESDPALGLHLENVDLKPIIDKAREYDTAGARKHKLRTLLFGELGLPPDGTAVEHDHELWGVKRRGMVRFGNVREMADAQLRCPSGAAWHLILDFPFDEPGFSPNDDLQRIRDFRAAGGEPDERTLLWLPTFFSSTMEKTLGECVVLAHILDRLQDYVSHLRPEDRVQAQGDLRSLRDQKEDQVRRVLSAAYGLTQPQNPTDLDAARSVDSHLEPLSESVRVNPPLAADLKSGMGQMIQQLLEQRYPQHPRFGALLTSGKLDRVLKLLERLIESPGRRMAVTAGDRKDLQSFADPLGLTTTTDDHTLLNEQHPTAIDQRRAQAALQTPTVADVRGYTDPDGYRGLTPEVQDLELWCYLLWSGRSLVRGGRDAPFTRLGQLPEDAELILPVLPDEQSWQQALQRGAELFGITFANRHLNALNLASFCQQLSEAAARARAAEMLAPTLAGKLDEWAEKTSAPRLVTAESAAALAALINTADGAELIERLAASVPETSATAVAKSLASAGDVLNALRSEARWLNFQNVRAQLGSPKKEAAARSILDELAEALRSDELNRPLTAALAELTRRAAALIEVPRRDWERVHSMVVEAGEADEYGSKLQDLAAQMAEQARALGDGVELKLEVTATLLKRKKLLQRKKADE